MLQRETGDIPAKYRLWQPEITDGEQKYQAVNYYQTTKLTPPGIDTSSPKLSKTNYLTKAAGVFLPMKWEWENP